VEKTLQVLNDMERAGVIGRYAVGGAVGAIFYMEVAVVARNRLGWTSG